MWNPSGGHILQTINIKEIGFIRNYEIDMAFKIREQEDDTLCCVAFVLCFVKI